MYVSSWKMNKNSQSYKLISLLCYSFCFYLPGAAMTHYHEGEEGEQKRMQVDISDEELENLIVQILKDDDLNDDGYVDYYEFVTAQKRLKS